MCQGLSDKKNPAARMPPDEVINMFSQTVTAPAPR